MTINMSPNVNLGLHTKQYDSEIHNTSDSPMKNSETQQSNTNILKRRGLHGMMLNRGRKLSDSKNECLSLGTEFSEQGVVKESFAMNSDSQSVTWMTAIRGFIGSVYQGVLNDFSIDSEEEEDDESDVEDDGDTLSIKK